MFGADQWRTTPRIFAVLYSRIFNLWPPKHVLGDLILVQFDMIFFLLQNYCLS